MDTVKIDINAVCSPCIDVENGQHLYNLIVKAFEKEKKVILSFPNVELTPTFLNAAVGQLYNDYSIKFVKDHLSVENMPQDDIALLKRVVDNAKSYYKKLKEIW